MNSNQKMGVLALTLAAAFAAAPALADSMPTYVGYVNVMPPSTPGDDTTPWSGSFSDTPVAGAFLDEFFFSAPAVQLSYLWAQIATTPGLQVSSVTLTYFGTTPDDPANVLATLTSSDPSGGLLALSAEQYGNGTFSFWIAGTSDGTATLSGTINAGQMAPVPEPAEWALLALGLGALRLLPRRRAAAAG